MVGFFVVLLHQLQKGDAVLGAVLFLLCTCVLCGLLLLLRLAPATGRAARTMRFSWHVGSLLALEQAYELTRGRIPHEAETAFPNAYRVLDLEWRHGLFVEQRVERFFLQFHTIMNAVDLFYVFSHVLVTVAALVWIYSFHREHFPFVRNLFILTTAIALVAFYLYPTAPPRMLWNYGFVDPLQLHHMLGAAEAQPSSYTYNPYAAMPSLHVGYALVVSWGCWRSSRNLPARCLAGLYPVVMSAVVIISGNHWLLDVIGAVVTVALAGAVLLGLGTLRRRVEPSLMRSLGSGTRWAA